MRFPNTIKIDDNSTIINRKHRIFTEHSKFSDFIISDISRSDCEKYDIMFDINKPLMVQNRTMKTTITCQ